MPHKHTFQYNSFKFSFRFVLQNFLGVQTKWLGIKYFLLVLVLGCWLLMMIKNMFVALWLLGWAGCLRSPIKDRSRSSSIHYRLAVLCSHYSFTESIHLRKKSKKKCNNRVLLWSPGVSCVCFFLNSLSSLLPKMFFFALYSLPCYFSFFFIWLVESLVINH